ncbi:lysine biosynthesis protein LysW [Sphaerimonospora thailandensis]|uniref:Lysine biosynthesis protein LysW n=1 Tax=Sphaerimonospora thailandensis TaxID=795644 RepID=A0A8J3R916_9ACTN|nr:lysine biosynthesis protein LysW [Sphaerimonospora thailandensis]GIH71606.1 lysine biosynthesis protein LysW [Sphaerimonospora thailandensis]
MTVSVSAPQCLVCDTAFEVSADWEKGEIIECAGCGQEHEVTEINGTSVSVGLAPEVEEDWGE